MLSLLKSVYHYYPVGYPYLLKGYPGYLEMTQIVETKINQDCNDPASDPNLLCSEIRSLFPNNSVENRVYENFPNYVYLLKLSEIDNSEVVHTTYLNVTISLLCDFYTIFFIDEFRVKGISPVDDTFISYHSIVSYSNSQKRIDPNLILQVTASIKKYFPDKSFISHSLIMRAPQVSGVTLFAKNPDLSATIPLTFYNLLFSNLVEEYRDIKD
jgi:hypothetical protein